MFENIFNNSYFASFWSCLLYLTISEYTIKIMKKRNIKIKDKIDLKKIDYPFLIKIMTLSFAVRVLMEQLTYAITNNVTKEQTELTLIQLIITFFVICIVAPITEEIIFRFGLYGIMEQKINKALAIILSSSIFSFLHAYVIYESIILTILTIIWTYSYSKKNNLIYPIILHSSHNIYAFTSYMNINEIYYIVFGIMCLIIYLSIKIKENIVNSK